MPNWEKDYNELLDDYNGAAKWLGVLESGDPLEGAAQAMNDKLCEVEAKFDTCIKMLERETNRANELAVDAAILETALDRIQGMASEDLWAVKFGGAISDGNLRQIEAYARGALANLALSVSELGRKGGQSTSESKKTASRKNGKKGGRPKKTKSHI